MQTTFVQQASDNPSAQTNSRQDSLLVPPPAAPGHVTAGARKRRLKTGRRIRWPAETTGANGNGQANRALIEALSSSRIYKEYERAFVELTGQPMSLQPVETWQLPYHGRRNENPFCALISGRSRACAACLQVRERLCQQAASRPRTVLCHSGLCETAVPVRLSDRVVGFLQTGQVFQKKPGPRQFDQVAAQVAGWGLGVNREALKRAYFSGKVVSPSGHESAVKLLAIFAQHLALISNQVIIQQENAESPVVTRAKEYIAEHQSETLRLGQVARAVHMSSFYFCKTFKRITGVNFTDYLCRVRIEKAKNLLLNPNLRISEIAFEVGFQSLTHFNRVFKKLLGQSPTDYRAQLLTH